MKTMSTIRKGKLSDISVLAGHRRLMFEEMSRLEGKRITDEDLTRLENAYSECLKISLKNGQLSAWVVENDGNVIASGALSIIAWPPIPGDSTGKQALLHSLFVDEKHRRLGIARQIMQAMLAYCRLNNLRSVSLNTSRAGQKLNESLGFKIDTTTMRQYL
ncbi:putative Acetyltransferase, GNAT family [Candidatus Zixiibacteriota bacterium]|nr:putative Acetyltransferase, GNAT family [candidate division Zixibacteria bacterium]